MKDKDLFDLVAAMTTTVDELQTTVGELEESQLAMKAEQEKFINGLDEQIANGVYYGIGKGLDESKNSITEHILWCQKVNNNLIEKRKEVDAEATESESKARKNLFRVQVTSLLVLAAMAAFGIALWLDVSAVQSSLDAANDTIQQSAALVEQVNEKFKLELTPAKQTQHSVVADIFNFIGMGLGVVVCAVIVYFTVVVFKNRK